MSVDAGRSELVWVGDEKICDRIVFKHGGLNALRAVIFSLVYMCHGHVIIHIFSDRARTCASLVTSTDLEVEGRLTRLIQWRLTRLIQW